MPKHVRAAAVAMAFLTLSLSTAGCFGKFALTRKVYGFNESIGDKWLRSLMLWVLMVIPVYAVAGLIDWLLLNLIEFWSGNNPAAMNDGQTIEKTVAAADGHQLRMILSDKGQRTRIEISRAGEETRVIELVGTAGSAVALDGAGRVLASTVVTADGGAEVRDAAGNLRASKSAMEVARLASSLQMGGEALLGALEVQGSRRLAVAR